MSHGEYTREDSRQDRAASFMGLALGIGWVLLVGVISYFIAMRQGG
jgi:Tfp pilus assembly protein PilW